MRLVLHIGSTKTGSSALQATLFHRRAALAEAGAWYSERGVAAGAHHLLAASIHPGAWRMHVGELPEDRAAYFAQTAAAILEEAREAEAHTLIISSEYFWGSLPPAVYRSFGAAFPDVTFEVVAFIRRQDEWAMSSYLQAVKSGEARDFAAWKAHVLDRPNSGLHYFRVINRWAHLLDAKAHVVRYQDAKRNVYAAFCEALGLDVDTDIEMAQVNPSPSADGLAQLLEVNRSDVSDSEKAAERKVIMREHRSAGSPVGLMSSDEREALLKSSETSDRLISRQFLHREPPLFGPPPQVRPLGQVAPSGSAH